MLKLALTIPRVNLDLTSSVPDSGTLVKMFGFNTEQQGCTITSNVKPDAASYDDDLYGSLSCTLTSGSLCSLDAAVARAVTSPDVTRALDLPETGDKWFLSKHLTGDLTDDDIAFMLTTYTRWLHSAGNLDRIIKKFNLSNDQGKLMHAAVKLWTKGK